MDQECVCSSDRKYRPTILFSILSGMDDSGGPGSRQDDLLGYGAAIAAASPRRCSCEEHRRTVCLQDPSEICRDATDVLVKTVRFIKNLPAFNQMPRMDQFLLLKRCWAPLFILGLAQEHLDFEVTDTPTDSLLKKILLNRQNGPGQQGEQPTMAGVSKLKSCLKKFWSLDLSPKEFAYLKGTAIFNPGSLLSSVLSFFSFTSSCLTLSALYPPAVPPSSLSSYLSSSTFFSSLTPSSSASCFLTCSPKSSSSLSQISSSVPLSLYRVGV